MRARRIAPAAGAASNAGYDCRRLRIDAGRAA